MKPDELILLEDDDLIFINKPAGISSLDERHKNEPSLLDIFRKYNSNISLCHRLDKDTSGVLVLSKHPDAYKQVSQLFEKRLAKKIYHAVVWGCLQANNKVIDKPLVQTKQATAKVDYQNGKPSQTIINTLKLFRNFSLLECLPLTGRFHQIRIHLASINHPIVADETYRGKFVYLSQLKKNFNLSKTAVEEPIIKRFALHAFELTFQLNGKNYAVSAPYPKDFSVLLKILEKHQSF